MEHLAATLRAAREEAGLSLDSMAQRVGFTKTTLSKVETGKRSILPDHVRAYEQALGVEGLADDMDRRTLISALAAVSAAEPLERLLDGVTSPVPVSQVGSTEVAAVESAVVMHSETDLRYGGAIASHMASGALRWSVSLLDAQMGESVRRRLSSAVGALSDRLAWSHHDSGLSYQARRMSELAIQTSSQGSDPTLAAHIRLNVSSFIGDRLPADAAGVLSGVADSKRVHTLERSNLLTVRARHLGRAGKQREALNSLAMAEDLLSQSYEAPPAWANFLTVPHLLAGQGRSYVAIGKAEKAAQRFTEALEGYGPERARGRAQLMIRLGRLRLEQGDREQAQKQAEEARQTLCGVRSSRAESNLADLLERL